MLSVDLGTESSTIPHYFCVIAQDLGIYTYLLSCHKLYKKIYLHSERASQPFLRLQSLC